MENRKKIRKCFLVWDFGKEEAWLNEMALNGWLLEKVGFCRYDFVRCEPGEYSIRLEMRPHDEAYLAFMEETGAKYVGRMVQWIYFRKKTADGPFDLFSDIDSKIDHLDRIGQSLAMIGSANLLLGLTGMLSTPGLSWVNLLCAALIMYCLGRIHGKKEALKKERLLHE